VPFARLDTILLLIKTCLKGPIVEMLNKKDNQVFLDYLAGGQSTRIAQVDASLKFYYIQVFFIQRANSQHEQERSANAASDGALNVAARNLAAAEESPVPEILTQDSARYSMKRKAEQMEMDELVLKKTQELHEAEMKRKAEIMEQLEEMHDADMKRKAEIMEQLEEMHDADMKRKAKIMEQQQESHDAEIKRKAQCNDFELKSESAMMKLKRDNKKLDIKIELQYQRDLLELRMLEKKSELQHARAMAKISSASTLASKPMARRRITVKRAS
jgi:hypothetical protein